MELTGRNQLPSNADVESFGRPMISASPTHGVGHALGMTVVLDPVRNKLHQLVHQASLD